MVLKEVVLTICTLGGYDGLVVVLIGQIWIISTLGGCGGLKRI